MEDNQFSPPPRQIQISAEEAAEIQSRFFAQVYGWMAAGLGLTGGIAMFASTSPELLNFVFGTRFVFLGLIILELVIVGFLSARIFDWSLGQVQAAFVGYAVLNGVTLSCVFLAYTSGSIASTFFVTAGTFGVMSLFGYFTKADLSGWGKLLSMAVIGLAIALVVNLFLNNSILEIVTSFIGVLLFTALTAYDTQKLKQLALLGVTEGEEMSNKASILGALTLYLDFVNLFLFLLRIFGRRR
ncbi:Bax inhibitor-1/YccA family protein [Hymenobacter sp. DH14]|uniref:Bax inhibitor-1/YccA family protein n=1 Tax=Hymenobacter cyanobacteriorum TaxID=2926463 RepID=A0A9X1VB26_9BACT|nr:Bax inhibitor-1/YccA family protein [Hymenobacter cyanobacteriorum]MCI1185789.1 Bax inhibitor-1/YccA family protein [Hymenobacter cyanobacteriorum]